jgi:hypothetical protein
MLWCLKGYIYSAAGMLALAGLALLYTAVGEEKFQQTPDAVFQLSSGTMLIIAGLLNLVYSISVFFTGNLMNQGFQIMWVGLNYLVYHVGMVLFHAKSPYPMLQLTGWRFGLKAQTATGCWNLLTAYLLMGGLLFLMLEWHRLGQEQTEAYMKQWAETKGHATAKPL